jgi:hypothetical protein
MYVSVVPSVCDRYCRASKLTNSHDQSRFRRQRTEVEKVRQEMRQKEVRGAALLGSRSAAAGRVRANELTGDCECNPENRIAKKRRMREGLFSREWKTTIRDDDIVEGSPIGPYAGREWGSCTEDRT